MENWAWASVGALFGWIVSQFGAVIRDVMRRHHLKREIVGELRQLHEEVERMWLAYARSLQIHSLHGVDSNCPLPLSNRVFQGHYTDALLVFTRVQRVAMEMIHNYVALINEETARMRTAIGAIHDDHDRGQVTQVERHVLGQRLRGLMTTVAQARWMITYYLNRPHFPELRNDGPDLHAYRLYVDNINVELDKIVKSVDGLTLEDFKSAVPLSKRPKD